MPRQVAAISSLFISAIVGQVVFLGSAWLLPFASEFGWKNDSISELVLGRYGFVQTVAFVAAGLGSLGLAIGLRLVTRGSGWSLAGAAWLAVNGVALLMCAVLETDAVDGVADPATMTASGIGHVLAAIVGFLSVVAAMVLFTFAFARSGRWLRFVPWSAILATAAVSLLLAQSQQGSWAGLLQRLLATVIAIWIIAVAVRAYTASAADPHGIRPIPDRRSTIQPREDRHDRGRR